MQCPVPTHLSIRKIQHIKLRRNCWRVEERTQVTEEQEALRDSVSPKNDKESLPVIPQQYSCLNQTLTKPTMVDILTWKYEISWNPTNRLLSLLLSQPRNAERGRPLKGLNRLYFCIYAYFYFYLYLHIWIYVHANMCMRVHLCTAITKKKVCVLES